MSSVHTIFAVHEDKNPSISSLFTEAYLRVWLLSCLNPFECAFAVVMAKYEMAVNLGQKTYNMLDEAFRIGQKRLVLLVSLVC